MALDRKALAQTLQVLGAARWLEKCSPEALNVLLRDATLHRFSRGQAVFHRGERIERLWIVLEGSLEMSLAGADGRKFVASYVPPGQAIGFIPLIDGRGAIHDARAHLASTLIAVPKSGFLAAMQADVELLQAVLRLVSERARRLNEWRAQAAMLPLATRLARLLLSLGAAYGVDEGEDGRAIALRIAQDDLAAIIGVSRQALNVEIKALERRGMVRLAYARVVLLDETALETLAREPAA